MSYCPNIVLITGATGDFGTAFAQKFAGSGAKLILHGRSEEKLQKLISELPENTKTHSLICEMGNKDEILSQIRNIPDDFKNIDLLINNAGLALGANTAEDENLEDWMEMIAVNNAALVTVTHEVLQTMVANKHGHIINIGSTAGSYPYPGGHVYCATKAFVKQFSLSLRADLYTKNIRVTNIEPGMVETQFSMVRFKGDSSKADSVYASTTPLTADDVAQSVFWAATLPKHCNINRIELMPTRQAPGALAIDRD
jgi:3-hydroxy acid dehydrogenase/malonic semialdehyde reductase